MRWHFKAVIAVVGGLVLLDLATGQPPAQLGGLTTLFANKDSGRPDPLALLRNAGVKKELRVTSDQLNKVDDAIWEALGKVLDPEQLKRLRQIDLQQRDYKAFSEASVQSALKLTKDQKDNIGIILGDSEKELAALKKELKGGLGVATFGGFQGLMEKVTSIGKDTKDRCTEVLNPDQKRVWQELVGDDFKLETPKIDFGELFKQQDTKKKKKGGGG